MATMTVEKPFIFLSYAAALFSLGLGVFGLFSPNGALRLVGLQRVPGLAHSVSEVRATYGGVFIGASVYPLVSGEAHAFLTLAACWILAGLCRLYSMLIDDAATRFNAASTAIEVGMGLLIALPYISRV